MENRSERFFKVQELIEKLKLEAVYKDIDYQYLSEKVDQAKTAEESRHYFERMVKFLENVVINHIRNNGFIGF